MIELHHVTAGYGKQPVLTDVSAFLEQGSLTSLIGVNGCGKSTLLKAIGGMLPLQSGNITLDGQPLQNLSRNEIARKIAYLSQGRNTPDMTVGQLVLHGRFPHLNYPRRYTAPDYEIATASMQQLGIENLAHKSLNSLSGGMRQKAYIAMALAQDTGFLLLDEPTTYLDIAHQLELMKILQNLAHSGKGILTVLHDMQLAFTFSDRIILLHEGKVIATGTPKEICDQKLVDEILGVGLECSHGGTVYNYRYFPK